MRLERRPPYPDHTQTPALDQLVEPPCRARACPRPPRRYAWGVVFNALALFAKDRERIAAGGLFQGYSPIVGVLIVNNALVGLAISAVLKFANNLVRVFAHTAAMLLTMILEALFMGAPVSPQLLTSMVVVSASTYLYNLHPPPRAATSSHPVKPMSKVLIKRSTLAEKTPIRDDQDESAWGAGEGDLATPEAAAGKAAR